MAVTLNASTSSGLVQTADTSGQIELQSNGTTKATVSSSGLAIGQYNPSTSLITSGTAVASTSGTSIDFTSIPSWVKRITVMFSGVSTSGTSNIQAQIGSGSVTTTGYVSGSTIGTTYTSATTGFLLYNNTSAADIISGVITICNITSNTWVEGGMLNNTGALRISGGNSPALSGTLDRVRITTVNGTDTFDAGSINILYE